MFLAISIFTHILYINNGDCVQGKRNKQQYPLGALEEFLGNVGKKILLQRRVKAKDEARFSAIENNAFYLTHSV